MQTASRRRTRWAIAASVLAHVAVLATALLYRPQPLAPLQLAAGPPQTLIPVYLTPRSHLAQTDARLPAAAPFSRSQAAPIPAQTTTASAPPSALASGKPTPFPVGAGGASGAQDLSGPDIRAALRHGATGCASLAATGMTRAERDHCDDQLAAGFKTAPVLTVSLDPRIRAYYDAVAKAKAPDKPLTPVRATGALGMFDETNYGTTGRPAGIGCHITWGPGEKKKLPSHWLKLGPCFIAPPQGPLTVEADITPPDQDLSHAVEHARPPPEPKVRRTETNANDAPSAASAGAAILGAPQPKGAEGQAPRS